MGDSGQEAADDAELAPAAAFSLLGDATRLAIVTALHEMRQTPVAFSDLYDRVDVRDSARFNYHLDRLLPHFIEKTERGYALTKRGSRVARAVTAGSYTESPERRPFETPGECYACGDQSLRARYEDEEFVVDCSGCGETVLRLGVPPTVVRDRHGEELVRAVDHWARASVEQAADGVCPSCGGRMNGSLSENAPESGAFDVVARFGCRACGRSAVAGLTTVAGQHPVVRTFHRQRGSPIDERPYWQYRKHVAHEHLERVDDGSGRVRVSFFERGDACHATLDEDLDVVGVEVVPRGAPSDR